MDWINLAQDMDQWRDLVNTVMNLGVPLKCWGNSAVAVRLAASQGLNSMELVRSFFSYSTRGGREKR
jgi:hypothetical protein